MTLISDWSPPRHPRQSVIPTTSLTMATILDESTNMLITSTPAPKTINYSQSSATTTTTTKQLACRRLFSEHQAHHHHHHHYDGGSRDVYDGVTNKHHYYASPQLYHEEDEQAVLMTEWLEDETSVVRHTSAYTSYLPSEYAVEQQLEEIVEEEEEEEEADMDANGNVIVEGDEIVEDANDHILLLSGVIRSEGSVEDIACQLQSEQLLELEPITFDHFFEEGKDKMMAEQVDDHQFGSINGTNSMTTIMEHLDLATTAASSSSSSSLDIMAMSFSSSPGSGTPRTTTITTISMPHGSWRREGDVVGSSVFDESPCGSPRLSRQHSHYYHHQPLTKRQRLILEDSSEGTFFSQPRLFTPMDTVGREDASLVSHSQPVKFVLQPLLATMPPPLSSIFTQDVVPLNTSMMGSSLSRSPVKGVLPCHASPRDAIPRVTPETVANLLHNGLQVVGDNEQHPHNVLIIDCRYPYEYEGGHIPGAINVSSLTDIDARLSSGGEDGEALSRTVYIFHCEFSSERAPRMALHVRKQDRLRNAHRYPLLSLPQLYVMEGGYKAFWQHFPTRCSPPYHYRPMLDGAFKPELRACQRASKAVTRQRKAERMGEKGGVGGGSPVTVYAVRRGFQGAPESMTSGISSEL